MNLTIIGNVIAFIASIVMVIANYVKTKQNIIKIQTIQMSLFVLSNLVLGGITGVIINMANVVRNILCYKDKLTTKNIIIINLVIIILSFLFNNLSIIGWLPVIASIIYTCFMNTKKVINLKLLIIMTTIAWTIYDITIKSYTSLIFDIFGFLASIISIYQIKIKSKVKV